MDLGLEERKLAAELLEGFVVSAINSGKLNSQELNESNIIDILENLIKGYKKNNIDFTICIDHTEMILNEAKNYKKNGNNELACLLYTTWIEHWINDVIIYGANRKNLTGKDIQSIIRTLNNDAKFSWLLPILDLPRLSEKYRKNIIKLIEKRNHFVHYKWKGLSETEDKDLKLEYDVLINDIDKTVSYLKKYKCKNLYNPKKIKELIKIN